MVLLFQLPFKLTFGDSTRLLNQNRLKHPVYDQGFKYTQQTKGVVKWLGNHLGSPPPPSNSHVVLDFKCFMCTSQIWRTGKGRIETYKKQKAYAIVYDDITRSLAI